LITGASAGLGVEFARQLSARGHALVLAARRKGRLDALAAELGNARAVTIDLSKDQAADRLMADLDAAGEHVDLLVNNAGFGLTGRIAEQDSARLRQMIDLNCGVLTELCRAVVPAMIERRSGAILNVASTAAFQPGPGMAVYFATKAYVLSFTEALHEELKGKGVHVTALCPGPTATEFGEVSGWSGKVPSFAIADAANVVRAGLAGLDANRAVVVPGLLNKLSGQGHRLLPRAWLRKIAGAIKY
jgi:short-subunit dehydrogenase